MTEINLNRLAPPKVQSNRAQSWRPFGVCLSNSIAKFDPFQKNSLLQRSLISVDKRLKNTKNCIFCFPETKFFPPLC